mmetsp:Transcript_11037/g.34830  ORF Transcript_11037/g.34830 Transcript_11037/m.34830 type:complete len:324 (-) Transcript_11037:93-1064(-)
MHAQANEHAERKRVPPQPQRLRKAGERARAAGGRRGGGCRWRCGERPVRRARRRGARHVGGEHGGVRRAREELLLLQSAHRAVRRPLRRERAPYRAPACARVAASEKPAWRLGHLEDSDRLCDDGEEDATKHPAPAVLAPRERIVCHPRDEDARHDEDLICRRDPPADREGRELAQVGERRDGGEGGADAEDKTAEHHDALHLRARDAQRAHGEQHVLHVHGPLAPDPVAYEPGEHAAARAAHRKQADDEALLDGRERKTRRHDRQRAADHANVVPVNEPRETEHGARLQQKAVVHVRTLVVRGRFNVKRVELRVGAARRGAR